MEFGSGSFASPLAHSVTGKYSKGHSWENYEESPTNKSITKSSSSQSGVMLVLKNKMQAKQYSDSTGKPDNVLVDTEQLCIKCEDDNTEDTWNYVVTSSHDTNLADGDEQWCVIGNTVESTTEKPRITWAKHATEFIFTPPDSSIESTIESEQSFEHSLNAPADSPASTQATENTINKPSTNRSN